MKISPYLLLVPVLVATIGIASDSTNEKQSETWPEALHERLTGDQIFHRTAALKTIRLTRRNHSQLLSAKIEDLVKLPDRKYHGPLHMAIQAVAAYRFEELSLVLLKHITINLDKSSFPRGTKFVTSVYFPAAQALTQIGGRNLFSMMVNELETVKNDDTLGLYGYVFYTCFGRDRTISTLKDQLDYQKDGPGRANRERLIRLLQEKKSLFPPGR